jgi:hypothetical protein
MSTARVVFRQYKEMIEAAKGLVACYWGMKSKYTEKQLERYKLKYEIACKFQRDNSIKMNPAKDFNPIYRGR